ncbi:MAG TPA: cytochrome c family protein, partial [Verrucomicrobiae bacterium]|nr:cytochrome c family protein [Verrucomicrobiae bacterium]
MSITTVTRVKQKSVWLLAVTGCFLIALFTRAQGVQHLSITQPGGMPGLPVMTGINQNTNGVTITWEGPSGYYQIYQKLALTDPAWQMLGGPTNLSRTANLIGFHSRAFFRVSGPSPNYSGARNCATCHGGIVATETNLPHAYALDTLRRIHQDGNPNCLVCHTVGFGLPTGFVSVTEARSTNFLAGVQCENCHGPAANHAANPLDFTVLPRVELAAQVCGGCHSDDQHPTFEEWQTSGHAAVVPTVVRSMTSSVNNINNCGRCHSGSARVALLHGENPGVTVSNDFDVAITCATCHDPHANHAFTNVLSGIITNQFDGIV